MTLANRDELNVSHLIQSAKEDSESFQVLKDLEEESGIRFLMTRKFKISRDYNLWRYPRNISISYHITSYTDHFKIYDFSNSGKGYYCTSRINIPYIKVQLSRFYS